MNSIEMADKLADALRAVLEQADAPAQCSRCSEGMESPVDTERLTAARDALAEYERSQVERVSRDKFARRMFSRQYR